jgi:hypothetical protein
LTDAYNHAYRLSLSKTSFPCFGLAGLVEEAGREVVLGPVRYIGLDVTRKVFVHEEGGFARYLEVFTNPTGEDIDLSVLVEGPLGSYRSTEIVVGPADTDNTFAVTQDGSRRDPALAHVFGGPGAPVVASKTRFLEGDDYILYGWSVTVPAGETVVLMHFAVQRDALDAAGAQSQAEVLVNLTEPNALVGMSAAERAAVVNFLVP